MGGQRTKGEEYDHFIPFALGGTSDGSNVQLACKACNHKKKWHTHPEVLYGPSWKDWAPGKPRPNI
jgi:5-methylcytosine-specific restriction endonuclease McrA